MLWKNSPVWNFSAVKLENVIHKGANLSSPALLCLKIKTLRHFAVRNKVKRQILNQLCIMTLNQKLNLPKCYCCCRLTKIKFVQS